ncbi:concanavalin A-like lectin/glucanase domain-containing protein [Obelidium mucronatum]|nr:concanavalin A-like lectin/glucanase domain-containing protein [Obelidium mucronatum]
MDQNTRFFFAFKSLGLLVPLFQNEKVRRFFQANSISVILVSLIRLNSKVLCNQAIATLAMCLQQGLSRDHLSAIPNLTDTLLAHILVEESSATKFYGNIIFDYLCDCTSKDMFRMSDEAVAEINLDSMTPFLYLSKNKLELRNDSWTFESARCNVSVSGHGKYAFEVTLNTDGIIQVGWATENCNFDPEGGEGVGDNEFSYAYDGNRVKKWHSYFTTNNSYGQEWASGDVITICIDLDRKTISYSRNGNDLGVAFENVDSSLNWYPAASLAGGQGCSFSFGGAQNELRYLPNGYQTISQALQSELTSEELLEVSTLGEVSDHELAWIVDPEFEWTFPSFYFEAQLSIFKDPGNLCPFQFGIVDDQGTLTVLVPVQNKRACIVSLKVESPTDSVLLDALHLLVEGALENDGFSDEIKLLAILNLFSYKDGIVLGCGFNSTDESICFTLNGQAINVLTKGDANSLLSSICKKHSKAKDELWQFSILVVPTRKYCRARKSLI